jgi:uncharacterized protein YxjI
MNMNSAFTCDHYLLRRQVLALTGKFRLYNPSGQLVLYSQQKMFRLKEDIRAYADESLSQELLYIQARQIIDFSAAYDVVDSLNQEKVGVLRRKGWRSLLRDEWEVLDAHEQPLGVMQEDNLTRAMLRRFLLGRWLPQDYDVLIAGQRVADLRQRFNLFRYELDLDFRMDPGQRLDHRLGIAAAILLGTIEGRQE